VGDESALEVAHPVPRANAEVVRPSEPPRKSRDLDFFQHHYGHIWKPALQLAKADPSYSGDTPLNVHNKVIKNCLAAQGSAFLKELHAAMDAEHLSAMEEFELGMAALTVAHPTGDQWGEYVLFSHTSFCSDDFWCDRRWQCADSEINKAADHLACLLGAHVCITATGPDPFASGRIVTKL
jgi:hypothetical protein